MPRNRPVFPMSPWALCALCLLIAGCSSLRKPDQVDSLLSQALRAAVAHHEFDLDPEASLLVDAIRSVDPDYPGVRELDEELEPGSRLDLVRDKLGMNRGLRPHIERSPRAQALLWLPDRLLDLLDIVTFGVHFGVGGFADGHVTRGFQWGGGFRSTGGLGLHDHRSLGLKAQTEAGLTLFIAGTHTYAGSLAGTSGTRSATDNSLGLHKPMAPLYQNLRDYWAIGASGTAGIFGAEVDFHPIQLADFLLGFVAIDFLSDDFAHTRRLKLDAVEKKLFAELLDVSTHPEVLMAYHEMKQLEAGVEQRLDGEVTGVPTEAPAAPSSLPTENAPPYGVGPPAAPQ